MPVFYRAAGVPVPGEAVPLYLHSAPTSADDWTPVLQETGGLAPDLIGFGRSGKGGHLDYSPQGMAGFVATLLSRLGIERVQIIGHGWGAAVALALTASLPGHVDRLVLLDAAPPLEPDGWHRLARIWRRRLVGELAMGSITRGMLGRALRGASAADAAWPPDRVAQAWDQFDQGTQRATLRLHRWADPDAQRELAETAGSLSLPILLLWGEQDGWFGPEVADGWAQRLPSATFERIPGAGHWPWLDRPDVAQRIAAFLAGR